MADEATAAKKEVLRSMKNASKNMAAMIDRVEALEHDLLQAVRRMEDCKRFIGPHCYIHSDNKKTVHTQIDEWAMHGRRNL